MLSLTETIDYLTKFQNNCVILIQKVTSPNRFWAHFWHSLYFLQSVSNSSTGFPRPILDDGRSFRAKQWHPYAQYFLESNSGLISLIGLKTEKIAFLSLNCHFRGKIRKMITSVDSEILTNSPYIWISRFFWDRWVQ